MINRLRILSIRHHLLWEFFVYWTSSWGIIISALAIFVFMAKEDVDTEFIVLLLCLVIFPASYWYWNFKIKAYTLLALYLRSKKKAQV